MWIGEFKGLLALALTAMVALGWYPCWRFCSRAGVARVWSVTMLVPIINVIVLYMLARWLTNQGRFGATTESPDTA